MEEIGTATPENLLQFCPHCKMMVSGRTYRKHQDQYYNQCTSSWDIAEDGNKENRCPGRRTQTWSSSDSSDSDGDNIVLQESENGVFQPVLIDFGKACRTNDAIKKRPTEEVQEQWLTKHPWIAPEVVKGEELPSVLSDIYGLGYIFKQMVNRRHLKNSTVQQLANACCESTYIMRPMIEHVIAKLERVKIDGTQFLQIK